MPRAVGVSKAGVWSIFQSNGPVVKVTLDQNGEALSGSAVYDGGNGTVTSGNVTNDEFFISVEWTRSSHGQYHGRFGNDGAITGITYDLNSPGNSATWNTGTTAFGFA